MTNLEKIGVKPNWPVPLDVRHAPGEPGIKVHGNFGVSAKNEAGGEVDRTQFETPPPARR